jgi:hypothetical protein
LASLAGVLVSANQLHRRHHKALRGRKRRPPRLPPSQSTHLAALDSQATIEAIGSQLLEAGGSIHRQVDNEESSWLVMQDPEGNEFCVNWSERHTYERSLNVMDVLTPAPSRRS